jgi:ATP-dependent DNA helicase DinG
MNYESYFPYDKIRPQQTEAIDFAIDKFLNDDKRFCIIEAGTGVGKSAIGLTVARVLNSRTHVSESFNPGSYFLTTQKILQEQYVNDFSTMSSLKSSGNYTCSYNKRNTCAQSQQMLRTEDRSSKFFKACTFNCKYKNDKQKFLDSSESITNFSYFMTEANYSGKITPRRCLIIDEGHNIEAELSKFTEVSVSEQFSKRILKIKFPNLPTQFQSFAWIRQSYFPAAKSRLAHFEKMIKQFGGESFKKKLSDFEKISKQYDLLRSHVSKLENFIKIYDKDNWVFESVKTEFRGSRKLTFKPIDVSQYAEEYLFRLGEKIIIMSATIIDSNTLQNTLGIHEDQASFISIPSPFPVKNRPIIFSPVASMTMKNIDQSLPKLAEAIKAILDEHPDEKGIIHCKTFKIANYLKNNIRNSRLLAHDSSDRDKILEKHMSSKKPTVLLSPSMTEGVDLKEDFSRFQIICKVPYPYLGDKIVKKRMNKYKGWYDLQTVKSIIQSTGRSVRSSDDYAVTYILDSDFERLFRKNSMIFPQDFKNCMI